MAGVIPGDDGTLAVANPTPRRHPVSRHPEHIAKGGNVKLTIETGRLMTDRKIIEYLRIGKSGRFIEDMLKIGDKRIKTVRELAVAKGYLPGEVLPGEALPSVVPLPPFPEPLFEVKERLKTVPSDPEARLLPHKEWMAERLVAGWHKITLFEELPVKVARSSFYRFLDRHGLGESGEAERVVPEIIHKPGEAMLLDWGHLCTATCPKSGKKRKVWAFVGVLGYSRLMCVRLVWSMSTSVTLDVLEDMFREIGGIPSRVTTDNAKCFSLEADRFQALLNPVFELFAAHHGFVIEALPAAEPEKKGKVERPMPYVRRLFEAHGDWKSLEEAQDYLQRKLIMANERKHGTTCEKPVTRFLDTEAAALRPLPPTAFDRVEVAEPLVREGGHVRFQNKQYSVGTGLKGEKILVLGTKSKVSLYHKGTLIESHDRIIDPNQSKSTKVHHRPVWEQFMDDKDHQLQNAAAIGPNLHSLVHRILSTCNGFVELRMVWGLFHLGKIYGPADLDAACEIALQTHAYTYRSVKHILEVTASAATKPTPEAKAPAYIRPISEYVNHIKTKEQQRDRHLASGTFQTAAPLDRRAGATRDSCEPAQSPRPDVGDLCTGA